MIERTTYKGLTIHKIRRGLATVYFADNRHDFKSIVRAKAFIDILTQPAAERVERTPQPNDLVFTNKHNASDHKCTIGQLDIKMCEILYHYKTTYGTDHQIQISSTPLMTLAQNMTDDEINAAVFTDAEMAAFLGSNGGVDHGYDAVAKMRGVM